MLVESKDEFGNQIVVEEAYVKVILASSGKKTTIGKIVKEENRNIFSRTEKSPFNMYNVGYCYSISKLLLSLLEDNDEIVFNENYYLTKKEFVDNGFPMKFKNCEEKLFVKISSFSYRKK